MCEELTLKDKIEFLLTERIELRKEIIDIQGALFKIGLTFITVVGTLLGVYLKVAENKNPPDNSMLSLKNIILFVATQVEFFMGVIGLMIIFNILVHANYLKALEEKINDLAKDNIVIWESEISSRFISSKGSPFLVMGLPLGILLYMSFSAFTFYIINDVAQWKNMVWYLFYCESVIIFLGSLGIIWYQVTGRVYEFASAKLG